MSIEALMTHLADDPVAVQTTVRLRLTNEYVRAIMNSGYAVRV